MNSLFIETLVSSIPHPSTHEKLKPYEPLIGDWDFDWVGHNQDGTTWKVPGEWLFSWILEGRAIQDNWICPSRSLRNTGKYPAGQYGTTIRFYDENEDQVKVVWIRGIGAQLFLFNVSFIDNQIIQQEVAIGQKSNLSKWVFKEIKPESFKWEAYLSDDDGNKWNLTQEVFAKRKATNAL
ncbi:MAG: hypothetical protein H6Q15_2193 [Bacteroidetes bacterium]|nr:hypothetical protein [Bacteroidota bacterium]